MRQFYEAFPKRETVSLELSWSHYIRLARIEQEAARHWYQQEAIQQGWSVRALERQISTLYYERLLSSQDRDAVAHEAEQNTAPLAQPNARDDAKNYLRDPCVLDFLNLPAGRYLEADLEHALIDNLQDFQGLRLCRAPATHPH